MIARALRQLAVLLALALLPALVSGAIQLRLTTSEPLAPDEVDLATVRAHASEYLWVDARSRTKFERAHIPGAVLLNEDEWDRLVGPFLDAWDPDKFTVVYCDGGSCDASRAVAKRLREELNLGNVRVLKGGWATWEKR